MFSGLVPFYRYWNNIEHFYTTNAGEIGTKTPGKTGNHGYTSEGIACKLSSSPGTGLVPLYRYFNGVDHFYTTTSSEIGTTKVGAIGKHGYKSEGIAGYCSSTHVSSSIPFYRYWNGVEHFYTTDKSEIGTIVLGKVGKYKYKYDGVACFVKP